MRWPIPKLVDAAIVLAASVALDLVRLHAFDLPLETDEANYAYIGARLLDGEKLYVDLWDHQPPGVYVLFAAAISLFGFQSGAALATVVGVLIEVPVMLSVVWIVNRSKGWYEAAPAVARNAVSERA